MDTGSERSIVSAALLVYPSSRAEVAIATDASDDAIDAVPQQRENDQRKPIGFFFHDV